MQGHKARLTSPLYNQAGLMCSFEFWYQVYGSSTSVLNVYIQSGNVETRIARIESARTDQWTNFKASLPSCRQQFQITLEGVRGSSNSSYIFVDDIRFNNCEYQRSTQPCTNDEFKCNSFHCVSKSSVCDLANDCCDKSDEQACNGYYRCSFEQGMCGFKSSNASTTQWTISRPDLFNSPNGPFYDHTTLSSKGRYLLVSASLTTRDGENAFARIGVKQSQVGCKMRIWYLLLGERSSLLGVWWRKETFGQLVSLFSTNEVSDVWKRVDVEIPEMSQFELVIEGVKAKSGLLAIDDVSFTPECQIDEDFELPIGNLTTPFEYENSTASKSTTPDIGNKDPAGGSNLF